MLYPCCGIMFGLYPKGPGRDCVCFVWTFLITELCWRQTPMTQTFKHHLQMEYWFIKQQCTAAKLHSWIQKVFNSQQITGISTNLQIRVSLEYLTVLNIPVTFLFSLPSWNLCVRRRGEWKSRAFVKLELKKI